MNETSDRSHFTPQGWHTVTPCFTTIVTLDQGRRMESTTISVPASK